MLSLPLLPMPHPQHPSAYTLHATPDTLCPTPYTLHPKAESCTIQRTASPCCALTIICAAINGSAEAGTGGMAGA